jgi:hypothetical protein
MADAHDLHNVMLQAAIELSKFLNVIHVATRCSLDTREREEVKTTQLIGAEAHANVPDSSANN